MRTPLAFLTILVAVVLVAAVAPPMLADNTASSTPFFLPANGSTITQFINGAGGTTPARWYVTSLRAGRSYCAETVMPFTSGGTSNLGIPILEFFQGDAVTSSPGWTDFEIHNPDLDMFASGPMGSNTGSTRYCNMITGTDNTIVIVFIKLSNVGMLSGDNMTVRTAVSETTLFAPWFYTDANYEAFTQVQNTLDEAVTFTVTHYHFQGSSGTASATVIGSPVTFQLGAFASTFIAAKGTAGVSGSPGDGGVKIHFTGPPGALKANVTSVNGTGIGLTHSFNIPFQTIYPAQMLVQ